MPGATNVLSEGDGQPMRDPAEIRAFYDATSDGMREVLDYLASQPGRRFTNPDVEAALGWNPRSLRATSAASTPASRPGHIRWTSAVSLGGRWADVSQRSLRDLDGRGAGSGAPRLSLT